jgi:hypothetical protein
MPSTRRFFRTTITVEVLSMGAPVQYDDLADVAWAVMEGPCVGSVVDELVEAIDAVDVVDILGDMGSDPEFFRLDDEGNDLKDEHEQ